MRLQAIICQKVLKQVLEAVVLPVDDLNRKLISKNEQKGSLGSENATLLDKIELADKIARDLRAESDLYLKIANERSAENAKLVAENENLEAEKEAATKQMVDLVKRCLTFEEDANTLKSEMQGITLKMETRPIGDERASFSLEHDEAVNKLKKIQENADIVSKELEISNIEKTELQAAATCEVSDLRKIIRALREDKSAASIENSVLLSRTLAFENEMHELKADKERLESDNSVLKEKIDDPAHKLESVEEAKNMLESEKASALTKLGESESSLKRIIDEAEQLRKEIRVFHKDQLDSQVKLSDLEKQFQDKEADFLSLEQKLEEAIQPAIAVDTAFIQINELKEPVKTMTNEATEKQSLAEKLESELTGKVLTQEMMLQEQKVCLDELSANYNDLEVSQGRIGVVQEQKLQLNRLEENFC
ncbi:unnamed protein product [Spirodela intermedia]|uniref:Uncharacterized protein n=1 Tax=Spirodela intermedia TaxID=51605 RepID=A0A7I8J612_SPIIN|nr:unnamed protein product [Spirodela intermedia]CAA6665676.1 unnamed protein product [Spirodela intermedia]